MKKWINEFYADKQRVDTERKYFNKLYDVCESLGLTMAPRDEIKWNPEYEWGGKTIYTEMKKHPENESKLPKDLWNDGVQTFSKRYYGNKETIWYLDKSEDYPSVDVACKAIKDCGGKVFVAHIFIYRWMKDINYELNELMKNYPIDGVECYHSDFSKENIEAVNKYCDENNYLKSGGSDYHGDNKPTIKLAIGKGSLQIPTDIIKNWYN